MFHKYPYTDFHDANLDYFLNKFKDITNEIDGIETSIEELQTVFNNIDDIHATKHYMTQRYWLHITNQAEFDAYLDLFNAGYTSLNAYIDAAGTYILSDRTSGYPVFNGVQMHLYATVSGVTIDLNGATFYNSHFVVLGQNVRVRIDDTNDTERDEYFEGGQVFFTRCDFYCSTRFWYSNVAFANCNFYEVDAHSGVCIDSLGSNVLLKENCIFDIGTNGESAFYPDYSLFGLGHNGMIVTTQRISIRNVQGNHNNFVFTKRQDGNGMAYLYSSCVNLDTGASYTDQNKGSFSNFANMNNFICHVRNATYWRNLSPNADQGYSQYFTIFENAQYNPPYYDNPYSIISMYDKIGIVGDSFANGYTVSDGGTAVNHPDKSWLAQMARKNGIDYGIYAWSGLRTDTWLTSEYGWTALNADQTKCDLYVLALGINDASNLANLGEPADIETYANTFYGNYSRIIANIIEVAPNAKMVMLSCGRAGTNYNTINAAIRTIAEYYQIPYIQQQNDYYIGSRTYTQTMISNHPTMPGYACIARAMERLLGECYIENIAYFNTYLRS